MKTEDTVLSLSCQFSNKTQIFDVTHHMWNYLTKISNTKTEKSLFSIILLEIERVVLRVNSCREVLLISDT